MTSKDRAYLRGQANTLEPVCWIGKDGLSDPQIDGIEGVLNTRELIKITILESCEDTVRDIADEISKRLRAEIVQLIGRKIVIYRKNKDINRYGV